MAEICEISSLCTPQQINCWTFLLVKILMLSFFPLVLVLALQEGEQEEGRHERVENGHDWLWSRWCDPGSCARVQVP